MNTETRLAEMEREVDHLRRSLSVQRRVVASAGSLAVLMTGLLLVGAVNPGKTGNQVIGVCGGDNYIYRVYDDGSVDFLSPGGSVRSARGVPPWAELAIDPNLVPRRR